MNRNSKIKIIFLTQLFGILMILALVGYIWFAIDTLAEPAGPKESSTVASTDLNSTSRSITTPTQDILDGIATEANEPPTPLFESLSFASRKISDIDINKYIQDPNLKSGKDTFLGSNYIKIDEIEVEGNITEGDIANQYQNLENGFWRYPGTGFPSRFDPVLNTPVFFGHRIQNLPPAKNTFYNLDKLIVGSKIEIGYDGKKYYYEVVKTVEVDSSDWAAIAPEDFQGIKLVTCTPLGSFERRIVVTAKTL